MVHVVAMHHASMEPRCFNRGSIGRSPPPVTDVALQWSRGALTAEATAEEWAAVGNKLLQWSRGALTAEAQAIGALVELARRLQWSRGALTAEAATAATRRC